MNPEKLIKGFRATETTYLEVDDMNFYSVPSQHESVTFSGNAQSRSRENISERGIKLGNLYSK